jgi:NAD+ kinase
MSKIQRIAIVANRGKPGLAALAQELAQVAEGAGVSAVVPSEHPLAPGVLRGCDACLTLGGDGTLLGVVAQAADFCVPVFGINRGKLGFLANHPSENAAESLLAVLRGDFQVSTRALLASGQAGNGRRMLALNDVVISSGGHTHMVRLRVSVDGVFVNSFLCDKLIVTTPSGSTAYNLSAGGPLIEPSAEVFAITPVCPHTLSNRSLIFPRGRVLSVSCESAGSGLFISVDGVSFPSECGALPFEISLAPEKFTLLQPPGFSHFELLRNKLRWA